MAKQLGMFGDDYRPEKNEDAPKKPPKPPEEQGLLFHKGTGNEKGQTYFCDPMTGEMDEQ